MTAPLLPPYITVVGHGRSGTNMVLDLFDCHRNTFCRNEPNELSGGALAALAPGFFPAPAPGTFATDWQHAVATAIRSSGDRDRFGTGKDYFRSPLRARLGQAVMSRRKLRALVLPRGETGVAEEWPCPASVYDLKALTQALPVLKILLSPGWILQAHAIFETQKVVHVIRKPQGFIQSWWGRYVMEISGDPEQVYADNQPSLRHILPHFGQPDPGPQPYSLYRLVVSELWRWRYMNELLLAHLGSDPRYLCVSFETAMKNRLAQTEALYDFAGLTLTADTRATVEAMQNTLFRARKSDGIETALVNEAIEEVMAGSRYQNQLGCPTLM